MSIVTVAPVYDLGTRADYLTYGVGEKKRGHIDAGTDRLVPGFFCDAPSVEDFVALGNRLAEQSGRKVKAQSYVLSFHPDELSVRERNDLQRCGDLAFLLAKKMHPNSPCLVVVHGDGRGGDGRGAAVHAHITVLNHDYSTGRALRDYRAHWQVKPANDELMAEEGMQVLAPKPKPPVDTWAARRTELPAFEQQLGDEVAEALVDPSAVDWTTFLAVCEARGVLIDLREEVVKSGARRSAAQGDTVHGITFKMRDESTPGKTHRVRRRKASALSSDFTFASITAALDAKQTRPTASPAPVAAIPSGSNDLARAAGRARMASRPARHAEMVKLLDGALMAGLFSTLDGFALQAAKIGVKVLRDRRRDFAYQRAAEKWSATELGERFGARAVEELAQEIAALRSLASAGCEHLALPELVDLMTDDEDPRGVQRRARRKTTPALTHARARYIEMQRGDRSFGR